MLVLLRIIGSADKADHPPDLAESNLPRHRCFGECPSPPLPHLKLKLPLPATTSLTTPTRHHDQRSTSSPWRQQGVFGVFIFTELHIVPSSGLGEGEEREDWDTSGIQLPSHIISKQAILRVISWGWSMKRRTMPVLTSSHSLLHRSGICPSMSTSRCSC